MKPEEKASEGNRRPEPDQNACYASTAQQIEAQEQDSQTIKPLETEFRAEKGFQFTQIARLGDVAIYHRRKVEMEDFEVVRIKVSKAGEMKVKDDDGNEVAVKFPARETYPSSEQWGVNGWTYTNEESARAKMAALLSQEATK